MQTAQQQRCLNLLIALIRSSLSALLQAVWMWTDDAFDVHLNFPQTNDSQETKDLSRRRRTGHYRIHCYVVDGIEI